ncbi:hypothetical protein [Nonomuraea sp. SBT364]|uniref:hypothetical protein n=1 Tax=Nonomuraea sp. SBT364 TaxID=1580530 RepID=UPI000A7B5F12|nr:hypothetical protein [Nonomuraea sp. SBT364]
MRIDETLLNEAKAYAARNGRSLNSVMEDALRQLLNRSGTTERPPIELPLSGEAAGPMLTWTEIAEQIEVEDIEKALGGRHAHA